MLINEEGEITGAISGGCLEGDALKKAMLALQDGRPRLIAYDTSDEEGSSVGVQLGCSGIVSVLFEPISTEGKRNPIDLLQQLVSKDSPGVLITLYEPGTIKGNHLGTYAIAFKDETITLDEIRELPTSVLTRASFILDGASSEFDSITEDNTSLNVFYEFIPPPIHLLIAGAGNDAVPVSKMAEILGWKISIADGRSTHARTERFSSACTIKVSQPERVLDGININNRTAILLMTHNYQYDLGIFKSLLPHRPGCILLLGPKKRYERMLDDLRKDGMVPEASFFETIYGPAGLEIGAETPEEIALSIISGIQAAMTGKTGGQLRQKPDVIHYRKG